MISVIIPVYNGGKKLLNLLEALKKTGFEIVVIDSSSNDGTYNEIKKQSDIYIRIKKESFDHGATRQKAAQFATGNILIFITQDIIIPDIDSFRKITERFEEDRVGAVYGRQLSQNNSSLMTQMLRYHNYPENSFEKRHEDRKKYGIMTCFFSDAFSAYKRDVFEEIGGFSEGLIFGEDMEIAARILKKGYSIFYNSEAEVVHSHEYSLIQDFRRSFDNGVFHRNHKWILDTFGSAGKQGVNFFLRCVREYLKQKKFFSLFSLFMHFTAKYSGYKAGFYYKNLPYCFYRKLTMNKTFWDKFQGE